MRRCARYAALAGLGLQQHQPAERPSTASLSVQVCTSWHLAPTRQPTMRCLLPGAGGSGGVPEPLGRGCHQSAGAVPLEVRGQGPLPGAWRSSSSMAVPAFVRAGMPTWAPPHPPSPGWVTFNCMLQARFDYATTPAGRTRRPCGWLRSPRSCARCWALGPPSRPGQVRAAGRMAVWRFAIAATREGRQSRGEMGTSRA